MKRRHLLLIIFSTIVLVIQACKSTPLTLDYTPTTQVTSSPKSEEVGRVVGRLVTETATDRIGLLLYLGQIFLDSNGFTGGMLDASRAPIAEYNDESGEFVFANIEPDKYSFIIYEVMVGGRTLTDSEGNVVQVEVQAGKTTDLGDINIDGLFR